MGRVDENENRSKIAITAESKEETYKLFNGLSAGGQIEMPINQSSDGTYLPCLEINSVLNGWSNLTQKTTYNSTVFTDKTTDKICQ